MDINLRFESNNKRIEVGKGKSYRLLNIDGIESTDNELSISSNVSADGSKVSNKKIKAKLIMIEAEYTQDNKEEGRGRLISFFNLHKGGRLVVKIGNIEKAIEYEIEGFNAKLVHVNNPLTFLISLYCPDPFFRDIADSKADISTEVGNIEFPLEIHVEGLELSIRTISYITNIYNQGDVDTPIKVKLKAVGTVVNPIIENLDTGEFIRVKRTLAEGESLEINTAFGNKRVEIIKPDGSRENVFHYIDYKSTFFSLSDGDNTIKYDAEVGENNLDVSIYYTPNYLGI